MTRWLVIVIGLALAACSELLPVTETTRETIEFESVDLPGALWDPLMPDIGDGTPVTIEARLTIPPTETPVPVVIITHGCGGPGDAELSWASHFATQGIASLVIDHFGGRGVRTICFGEETVNIASMLLDVYRAANALESSPYVDPDRMVVLGLSFGGRTALWTALREFRDLYGGRTFSGHIALYPSTCFIQLEDEHQTSGAPIRILHGTADDWTPIEQCEAYVDRMRAHSVDIALLAYEDAPHAFDNPGAPSPPVEIPAVSPRSCVFEERNGEIIDTDTDEIAGVDSSCVERGVRWGFDSSARDQARADVSEFLANVFER